MYNDQNLSPDSYQKLLDVAGRLVAEPDIHRLCETILAAAQKMTGAEGGTLYLTGQNEEGEDCELQFVIVNNRVLDLGESGSLPPIPLFNEEGSPNQKNISSCAYHKREDICIDDAYETEEFDFSGTRKFDEATGYRSRSFLAVPLLIETGQVIGVFQLINATDTETGEATTFSETHQSLAHVLANFAATAIEQQLTTDRQRELLVKLSGVSDTSILADEILREAKAMTNADGGSLYLLKGDEKDAQLEFSLVLNDSLNISLGGQSGNPVNLPPVPLYNTDGSENRVNVASYVGLTGESVRISDAYSEDRFDLSGTRKFDESTGYHSKSFLTVPLKNHENDVIGVLQLLNARDFNSGEVIDFSVKGEIVVKALSSFAAIALHNRILLEDLKNLLDAFIKAIAQAIDAKSSHTSAHCQRIPLLMEMIAQAACEDEGKFKEFQLDEDEWYELQVASWMHDCGKLSTPDSVLDKSTKLHLMRDGIHEVEARFASMRQQRIGDHYKALSEGAEAETAQESLEQDLATLEEDCDFLVKANKGGEFMSDEHKDRVQLLAGQEWIDHQGKAQALLTQEEVDFLCIARGTLSYDERQIINNHMVVTLEILEGLPFPKKLKRVPEYAGGHHEKMDGTGFPRGLTRDQMSIPARMMSIADIFEALTSKERPYKDPMKLSQALSILKNMKEDNHIDPDIHELFVKSRVWETYAEQELLDQQKDVTDISPYL